MFKEFLKRKGWISTMIGVLLAVPIVGKIIITFYKRMEFSEIEITTISVLLVIAMLFIILPSKIEFNAGKITFKVED